MQPNTDFSPVFIVGHPRSGSTLLASLLGEHSMVTALPESHFVRSSLYAGTPLKRWMANRNAQKKMQLLFSNVRLRDTGLTEDEFALYCQKYGVSHDDPAQLLRAFMTLFREKSGKTYVLEKTPGHIAYVRQIIRWLPDAKIIFTVRDPRDAVDSLLRVKWTHSKPKRHASYWAWSVRTARSILLRHPDRSFIVKYEDLLLEPVKSLTDVCAFLGIDYQPGMLSEKRADSVVPTWEADWKSASKSVLNPKHANQWKQSENARRHTLVEQLALDEMRALGYEIPEGDGSKFSPMTSIRKMLFDQYTVAGVFYREYLSGKKNRFREQLIANSRADDFQQE